MHNVVHEHEWRDLALKVGIHFHCGEILFTVYVLVALNVHTSRTTFHVVLYFLTYSVAIATEFVTVLVQFVVSSKIQKPDIVAQSEQTTVHC